MALLIFIAFTSSLDTAGSYGIFQRVLDPDVADGMLDKSS